MPYHNNPTRLRDRYPFVVAYVGTVAVAVTLYAAYAFAYTFCAGLSF